MNTPVNFELAKLLKEKGFHELTWQSYRTIEHTDERLKWWKVGELNKPMYCKLSDSNDAFYGICSAPTIAEVVMWLYEIHGVWIYVTIFQTDTQYYSQVWIQQLNKEDFLVETGKISHTPSAFNSPTEAYEAAIEYTLNNLI